MSLELKLARHVAGVNARIIEGDVEYSDGHVLQVLAPVPLQAALEGALHLLVAIPVLVDLPAERQQWAGERGGGRAKGWDRERGRRHKGKIGWRHRGTRKGRAEKTCRENGSRQIQREKQKQPVGAREMAQWPECY